MAWLADLFLISHGLNVLVGFMLVLVSIRLFLKSRIQLVLFITMLMGSWTLTNLLLIVPFFNEADVNDPIIEYIASWNVIGSAIVPALFILFIDAFEGDIDAKKSSVAIACLVTSIFIAIMGLVSGQIDLSSTIVVPENTDLITMRWSPITSLAIFPTVLLCGIWTQKELNRAKKHVIDHHQYTQIRYMKLGAWLLFFIGPFFGIVGVVLVDGFGMDVLGTLASEIVGYIFVSIGIIMITLAYLTADEIAFLQPQRIDSVLVIYNTGIPVISHNFIPDTANDTDFALVSGAISAITALMSEAFNVSSDVKEIRFHDKELLLEFVKLDNSQVLAFILFTDRKSSFLETALKRFSREFLGSMQYNLMDGVQLNQKQRDTTISMLRTAFGLS